MFDEYCIAGVGYKEPIQSKIYKTVHDRDQKLHGY
mgnify:CR=1 FL=1